MSIVEKRSPDTAEQRERIDVYLGRNGLSPFRPRIVPLTGDASDRRYYRIQTAHDTPFVLALHATAFDVHTLHTDQQKIALRKEVSIVFQQYNLFPHKTALQNVMMAPVHVLKEDKDEVHARAVALLAKVGLSAKADAYPGELSGGQQQRVAIARSLAMRPEVMLFDEITAALDPETVKEVLNTIRELAQDGMTCMLVTHEMRFARELADDVYFTDGGLIVESGPPAELFDHPQKERTRAFLSQIL